MIAAIASIDSAWVATSLIAIVGGLGWAIRVERLVTRIEASQEAMQKSLVAALAHQDERLDRHSDVNDGHAQRLRECEEKLIQVTEACRLLLGMRKPGDDDDGSGSGSGLRKRKGGGS